MEVTTYQQLLDVRRVARAQYPEGHPERVLAEQLVRKAKRARKAEAAVPDADPKAPEVQTGVTEPAYQPETMDDTMAKLSVLVHT
jgi:hypothetical protein